MTAEFHVEPAAWAEHGPELTRVRRQVFVQEQGVPESLELDGRDPDCLHVVARDGAGHPVGTGRLLPDGHIGRMAVVREWRGRGVGRAILDRLLEIARARGYGEVRLNAQTHALEFYRRAGFRPEGREFLDAGIPHRSMVLPLDNRPAHR